MKERVSPSTGRRYPFTMVCKIYRLARSSGYAAGLRAVVEEPVAKRGPRPEISDKELLGEIRREIESCPFVGEGHRKVHRRLNDRGVFTGRGRVLRLMRRNGLLVPQRNRRVHGNPAHTGTIVTKRPNEMWGADGTTSTPSGTALLALRRHRPRLGQGCRPPRGQDRRPLRGPRAGQAGGGSETSDGITGPSPRG